MNNTSETIADIIAEMRNDAERTEHMAGDGVQEILVDLPSLCREFADRLEAAWKREVDALTAKLDEARHCWKVWSDRADELKNKCNEQYAKLKTVGDAAKLREALKAAKRYLDGYTVNIPELRRTVDAALAAPPRNCDIGTVDEQTERFVDFTSLCFQSEVVRLVIKWAQMPYEEGDKE